MKKRAYFYEKTNAVAAKRSLEKAGISDFKIAEAENVSVPDVGIAPRDGKSVRISGPGLYKNFVTACGSVILVDKYPLTEKIISNHRGIFIE